MDARKAVEVDESARFPPDVYDVLVSAGWYPGRTVDERRMQHWIDVLARFTVFDSAVHVLREFGGLEVDQRGPGVECAREPFVLDPELALHEDDRFREYTDLVRQPLYPLGEAVGGHYFIALDPESHTYLVMNDIRLLGSTFEGALEALIRGYRAKKV